MDRIIQDALTAGIDTIVVDVKDESGYVRFPTRSRVARAAHTVYGSIDLPGLITRLHSAGLRLEVKLSVFKDLKLSQKRPDLQLKYEGEKADDDSGLSWVDPANPDVINYNVFLALELAKAGVDAIQFDYVRYQESLGLETHGRSRVDVITRFLEQARNVIKPLYPNVTLSADVYAAIACRDSGPTVERVGQDFVKIARIVDRVNLMAYPALYDHRMDPQDLKKYMDITACMGRTIDPVDYPGEIIEMTCESAKRLLKDNKRAELGLFLQSFSLKKHRTEDHTPFNCEYVKAENEAAVKWGVHHLYYWNPSGDHSITWEAAKDFRENHPLKPSADEEKKSPWYILDGLPKLTTAKRDIIPPL